MPDVTVEIARVGPGGGEHISVETGPAGDYDATGLEPGTYTVAFWPADYFWTFWGAGSGECPGPESEITLASHQARNDISVTLHRYNRVSGRVTLTDGTPVRNAFIYVEREGGVVRGTVGR